MLSLPSPLDSALVMMKRAAESVKVVVNEHIGIGIALRAAHSSVRIEQGTSVFWECHSTHWTGWVSISKCI